MLVDTLCFNRGQLVLLHPRCFNKIPVSAQCMEYTFETVKKKKTEIQNLILFNPENKQFSVISKIVERSYDLK